MSKYYIRINEKLMASKSFNSTEKLFIGFLEVLTAKGTKPTDKANTFFGEKLSMSSTYISTMIAKLAKMKVIYLGKKYSRRQIELNTPALIKAGFITEKAKRGPNKKW